MHAGLLAVAGAFAHAHSCAYHLRQLHLSHNCRSHERTSGHNGAAVPKSINSPQPSFIGPDGTAVQVNMLPTTQNPSKMRSKWMRVPTGEDAETMPMLPSPTDVMHEPHAFVSGMQAHNCVDMLEALVAMAPNLVSSNLPRLQVCLLPTHVLYPHLQPPKVCQTHRRNISQRVFHCLVLLPNDSNLVHPSMFGSSSWPVPRHWP